MRADAIRIVAISIIVLIIANTTLLNYVLFTDQTHQSSTKQESFLSILKEAIMPVKKEARVEQEKKPQSTTKVYSIDHNPSGNTNKPKSRKSSSVSSQTSLKEPEPSLNVIIKTKDKGSTKSKIIKNGGNVKTETSSYVSADYPPGKIEDLEDDPEVEGVYPNLKYEAMLFGSVQQIKASTAWDMGYSGRNVKIAVLDTGVQSNHSMLNGKVMLQKSFVGEDANDYFGHGTYVAGIAAGRKKSGQDYNGVAPEALILNAKVLDDNGQGYTDQIIAGVEWAAANGADIISMSFGSPNQEDVPLKEAILSAINSGVIVVASAGNCGSGCPNSICRDFRGVTSPGSIQEVISVGAVDSRNNIACFSSSQDFGNYKKPEMLAPGVNIASSYAGGYKELSGTSVSAPHVAGAIAIALEINPELSQSEIRQIIRENENSENVNPVLLNVLNIVQKVNSTINYTLPQLNESANNSIENELFIIDEDIWVNEFTGKIDIDVDLYGYYGQMADYQNLGSYRARIGAVKFKNESLKSRFFDENINYTEIIPIGHSNVFYDERLNYYFWASSNFFVWVMGISAIDNNTKPIFDKYLEKFPISQEYSIKLTGNFSSLGLGEVFEIPESQTYNLSEAGFLTLNDGCTDSCDNNAYKTDLPTGSCNNQKDYYEKGTTYTYELGISRDDECSGSQTLDEYFLKCDYSWSAWCPGQGGPCDEDQIWKAAADCSSIGDGWGCSDGECVYNQPSCDYSPACNEFYYQCYSDKEFKEYTPDTACSGGCDSEYRYRQAWSCGRGTYCSGDKYGEGSYPCYSCSSGCDGVCQSSNCYGYDPDCKSDGSSNQCCSDSQCGAYEKCSSGTCVDKTCSDSGKPKSCSYASYVSGLSECNPQGSNGDPTKCLQFGRVYCYDYTDSCSENEYCDENGFGDSICSSYQCSISSSYWGSSEVDNGASVSMTAEGSHCSGKTADFDIYEDDCPGFDIAANSTNATNEINATAAQSINTTGNFTSQSICASKRHAISSIPFDSGKFRTSWNAVYEDDIYGMPDYYFNVMIDGNEMSKSGFLRVRNGCMDGDGDDYYSASECGQRDCDDGNAAINPGAQEICNSDDDDCDGSTDESPDTICGSQNKCSSGRCLQKTCEEMGYWGSCSETGTSCISNSVYSCEDVRQEGNQLCYVKKQQCSSGQTCVQESQEARCSSNVECYTDNECTDGEWTGQNYCNSDDNVVKDERQGSCASGKCAYEVITSQVQTCQNGCSGGSCDESEQCGIPDGSSYACSCSSDADCQSFGDYYCDFVSGPNPCRQKQYNDECSNHNDYFCEESKVIQCSNNGRYWEKKTIERCTGRYQYCDPEVVDGTGECSQLPNHMDAWLDWADPNVAVAKQKGDKLILNVYSEQDTSARISYNTAAFNGECPNGNFGINEGLNTCSLEVNNEAPLGMQKISVGSKALDVKITDSSDLLIITDSEKMFERYPAEPNGVKAVLRQAYSNAEDTGIVYDLSQYNIGAANPFQKMINYVEKIFKPSITDNTYSLKVSNFIKGKCSNCKDVMLIGDDFVVPHYRRDISNYEGYLWQRQLASSNIYTDQHLIKKSYKPLSEIEDLFTKKQDVKLIIGDNLKSQLHGKVEELKTLIESKYLSTVEYLDPAIIGCNSFSELDDSTLIIIGGEENNALKCHPFIPKEDSYLSLERNVWDIGYYSILLNPTAEKYDNILALYNIIENGPDVDWDFKDTVIACVWDGKFAGSVPTAKEITCNMIPLVELAPDVRDSWKCLFANKDKDSDDGVVNYFVCGVVHFATGYDMATWGAAIFTFGATGAGGEVFDGGIATLKVFLKNTLPSIVKGIGRKAVKDAAETIVAAPKLLKSLGELVWRFPSKIPDMIEGGIQILKHGPEVAEEVFTSIKNLDSDSFASIFKNADDFDDVSSGVKSFKKVGIKIGDLPYGEVDNLKFLERFGETLKKFDKMPQDAITSVEFKELSIAGKFDPSSKVLTFPKDSIPEIRVIAHELSHAESLKRLSDKIATVNPSLANKIDNGDNLISKYIRGLSELIADNSAHKYLSDYPLDDFISAAKNYGKIDLESANGVGKLFQHSLDMGYGKIGAVNYLAYVHAIAKKVGNNNVVNSIETFIKTTDKISVDAKDQVLELAKKLHDNIEILEKPAETAAKETEDIIKLNRDIEVNI